jgi:CubicO group peptidase (beta-lactamase class C family)
MALCLKPSLEVVTGMVASNTPLIPLGDVVQGILAARVDDYRLSVGMAVGISDAGSRRLISQGYSDRATRQAIDGDTIFDIGSVTKLFTVLLLSDMVCRGEVSLDDPVADYLPSGAIPGPTT